MQKTLNAKKPKKMFSIVLFFLFPTSFMLAMDQDEQAKKVIALTIAKKQHTSQSTDQNKKNLTQAKSRETGKEHKLGVSNQKNLSQSKKKQSNSHCANGFIFTSGFRPCGSWCNHIDHDDIFSHIEDVGYCDCSE